MGRTAKNIVVVFTIICAIFLVIFSVELVLLNRDAGNGASRPALSGGASGENGDNGEEPSGAEGQDSNGNGGSGGNAEGNGTQGSQESPPPPPTGRRNEWPLHFGGMSLVFYVDDELFEHSELEEADQFSYTGGGSAQFLIGFASTAAGSLDVLAASALEGYLEDEPVVSGEGRIRNSTLSGVSATGDRDGETFEAWVHQLAGSGEDDLALVFVINYQNETQRTALYAIIDSLDIISD